MRRAFFQAIVIFLLLLIPLVGLWLRVRSPTGDSGGTLPTVDLQEAEGSRLDRALPADAPLQASEASEKEPAWENPLAAARDSRDRRAGLRAIAESLQSLDRSIAVARILAYLESGRDVKSGLPFALGMNGQLTTAPTLRVWLLDWLGRIDPKAAADFGAQVFEGGASGSADEWAMHLRNHAWGYPEEVETVVAAALAMLEYRPWRDAPTTGFQESFDVFVWAGDSRVVAELVRLIPASQSQALRVPANLALDRLVLNQPGTVLAWLSDNFGTLDANPLVRAGYFARADLAQAAQRVLVEDYFLDREITGEERDYFLEMIPNLNLTFSHNLLSENPRPTREENERHLESAERLLVRWLSDARFGAWRREIKAAIARIKGSDGIALFRPFWGSHPSISIRAS